MNLITVPEKRLGKQCSGGRGDLWTQGNDDKEELVTRFALEEV